MTVRATFIRTKALIIAGIIAALTVTSCNSADDSEEYTEAPNLAVTAFSLKANSNVTGLDSAYFAIDLNHGVIFNADSLRMGTKVDKVVADITYSNLVESAVITMSGGTTRTGEIDYKTNPTDSIDFTGDVTLTLSANNGALSRSYRLKVNVHKQNPDVFAWVELEQGSTSPVGQLLAEAQNIKTVKDNGRAYMFATLADGTYHIYSCSDFNSGLTEEYHNSTLDEYAPLTETFNIANGKGYVLNNDGELLEIEFGTEPPVKTGEFWTTLIGSYEGTVVGIASINGRNTFTQYPLRECKQEEIPAGFPVHGSTNLVTLVNKWTSSPVALMTGGTGSDGMPTGATWAFDGANWVTLNSGSVPALNNASMVKYYNYRPSAAGTSMIEYEVWLIMGGTLSDGTFNRTVYISYDNGVNWLPGSSLLLLPDAIPGISGFDAIVMDLEHSASIADGWKKIAMRLPHTVEGDKISWECPYIYLLGGRQSSGNFNREIWRGVLSRMTFTPII
ncbi:MAG: hypothetical protein HDT02_02400 [Bacteroidales bacterium]|nr:hypothetical protein [Bacteroidales bacterium]